MSNDGVNVLRPLISASLKKLVWSFYGAGRVQNRHKKTKACRTEQTSKRASTDVDGGADAKPPRLWFCTDKLLKRSTEELPVPQENPPRILPFLLSARSCSRGRSDSPSQSFCQRESIDDGLPCRSLLSGGMPDYESHWSANPNCEAVTSGYQRLHFPVGSACGSLRYWYCSNVNVSPDAVISLLKLALALRPILRISDIRVSPGSAACPGASENISSSVIA